MPKKADPLGNPGASKVFYALARGPRTPSAIAKELKMTHASASEHLRGLQKIGAVRPGPKEGRLQYYRVDWGRVAGLLFEFAAFSAFRWDLRLTGEVPTPKELDRMDEVASKLGQNGVFLRLLRRYFEELAWTFGDRPRRTVREELFNLEFALMDASEALDRSVGELGPADGRTREFRSLMTECRNFYRKWRRVADVARRSASALSAEIQLRSSVLGNPDLIGNGFRPTRTDVLTDSGEVIDLIGKDRDGKTVVVVFRRGAIAPSDVRQLDWHVRALAKKLRTRPRGVLAGQEITRDAEELLRSHGHEFRKVEPPRKGG